MAQTSGIKEKQEYGDSGSAQGEGVQKRRMLLSVPG